MSSRQLRVQRTSRAQAARAARTRDGPGASRARRVRRCTCLAVGLDYVAQLSVEEKVERLYVLLHQAAGLHAG